MKKALKKTHRNHWKPKQKCICPRCYYYWLGFNNNNVIKETKNYLINIINDNKSELGTVLVKQVIEILKKG